MSSFLVALVVSGTGRPVAIPVMSLDRYQNHPPGQKSVALRAGRRQNAVSVQYATLDSPEGVQQVPISVVIFDFGSTLIRSSEPRLGQAVEFLLSRVTPSHSLKSEDLLRFDETVFQDMLERRTRSGLDFTLTQYLTLLQACLGIRFAGDLDEVAFECWFRQYEPKPESGAADCLRVLKGRGVKLGVLSNTVLTRRCVELALERLGMLDFFDVVLCSSDVAYRKPHSLVFQAILRLLGATPESTAMVGDSLEDDIAGAISCGITPVWYNPHGDVASSVKPDHIVSDLRSVPSLLGIH